MFTHVSILMVAGGVAEDACPARPHAEAAVPPVSGRSLQVHDHLHRRRPAADRHGGQLPAGSLQSMVATQLLIGMVVNFPRVAYRLASGRTHIRIDAHTHTRR